MQLFLLLSLAMPAIAQEDDNEIISREDAKRLSSWPAQINCFGNLSSVGTIPRSLHAPLADMPESRALARLPTRSKLSMSHTLRRFFIIHNNRLYASENGCDWEEIFGWNEPNITEILVSETNAIVYLWGKRSRNIRILMLNSADASVDRSRTTTAPEAVNSLRLYDTAEQLAAFSRVPCGLYLLDAESLAWNKQELPTANCEDVVFSTNNSSFVLFGNEGKLFFSNSTNKNWIVRSITGTSPECSTPISANIVSTGTDTWTVAILCTSSILLLNQEARLISSLHLKSSLGIEAATRAWMDMGTRDGRVAMLIEASGTHRNNEDRYYYVYSNEQGENIRGGPIDLTDITSVSRISDALVSPEAIGIVWFSLVNPKNNQTSVLINN